MSEATASPVAPAQRTRTSRLEKNRLGTVIVETLKERILHWEYPPGYPLGEEALGKEFEVSRSPIREALHTLEAAGLVVRMSNRTFVVKQTSPEEIKELYDLRLALEQYALEELELTPEARERIVAMIRDWQGMSAQAWDRKTTAKADEQFHETLASLYGNQSLLDCLRGINQRLFVFRMIDFDREERLINTSEQHVTILNALLEGNKALATETLKANVEFGRQYVDKAIREMLVKAYSKL